MDCYICQTTFLPEDKKMEYECGCHTVHTRCGINLIHRDVQHTGTARCDTCMVNFLEDDLDSVNSLEDMEIIDARIQELKQDPVFKEEYKKLKRKNSELRKAQASFSKKLTEQYQKFKEATNLNILSLKLSQRESMATVKGLDEFAEAKRKQASATSQYRRFKEKYNLGYSELRALGLRRRYRFYRYSPLYQAKRKFRIRLY
jgi:hypothetical protein